MCRTQFEALVHMAESKSSHSEAGVGVLGLGPALRTTHARTSDMRYVVIWYICSRIEKRRPRSFWHTLRWSMKDRRHGCHQSRDGDEARSSQICGWRCDGVSTLTFFLPSQSSKLSPKILSTTSPNASIN